MSRAVCVVKEGVMEGIDLRLPQSSRDKPSYCAAAPIAIVIGAAAAVEPGQGDRARSAWDPEMADMQYRILGRRIEVCLRWRA